MLHVNKMFKNKLLKIHHASPSPSSTPASSGGEVVLVGPRAPAGGTVTKAKTSLDEARGEHEPLGPTCSAILMFGRKTQRNQKFDSTKVLSSREN